MNKKIVHNLQYINYNQLLRIKSTIFLLFEVNSDTKNTKTLQAYSKI